MNLNHPRWEGHQFNNRRNNPLHYSNSSTEAKRIRNLHSTSGNIKDVEKNQLNEWATLSSDEGQLNMEQGNHALSSDRHGLVVNHLNEVSKLVDQESLHEFVEEVNKVEERLGYVKKNR
tara:strand:+ start:234 stop:590 length:357 start_codon:yes stop_codon:yes gene_type:complete